jgi:hypothetical protein
VRFANENESASAVLENQPLSDFSSLEALFGSFVGTPSISSCQSNNASLDWIFFDGFVAEFKAFSNANSMPPSPPHFLRFAEGDADSPTRGRLPTPLTNCSPPHPSTSAAVTLGRTLPAPYPNSRCPSFDGLSSADQPAALNNCLTLPPLVFPTETSTGIVPTASSIQDMIQARPAMIGSLSIASRVSPWHDAAQDRPAVADNLPSGIVLSECVELYFRHVDPVGCTSIEVVAPS